jgi:HD-GYP domain-containing protein (c-di-GMP phosphodiesterase class II)
LPFSATKEEISRESGRQFDPKIAGAFLSVAEEVMRGVVLREKKRSGRVPLGAEVICERMAKAMTAQASSLSSKRYVIP